MKSPPKNISYYSINDNKVTKESEISGEPHLKFRSPSRTYSCGQRPSAVRQEQRKRTVSVFVVDKRSRENVKPGKDMVLRQLSSLGVKVKTIIVGNSYAFWDILLLTIKKAFALTRKSLENKGYFSRTEYLGRRQTTVSVNVVPCFLRDANLAAYMLNYGNIVSASHDGMHGE